MQRWKAITAVLEKPPECECGAAIAGDWAYCPRCARALGRRRTFGPTAVAALAVAAVVLAFGAGVLLGGRRGDRPSDLAGTRREAAELRTELSDAETAGRRLKDRNEALWGRLTDRDDAIREQLLDRHAALQTALASRDDSAREQLKEQDASIGLLAGRALAAEQLEEENAGLRESMQDTREQLRTWLELQETANGTPAAAAGRPAGGEPSTPETVEAFWAQFDAAHPTVDGRAIWDESVGAAAAEAGPDTTTLREHATQLFGERLAQAEEAAARGAPIPAPDLAVDGDGDGRR